MSLTDWLVIGGAYGLAAAALVWSHFAERASARRRAALADHVRDYLEGLS